MDSAHKNVFSENRKQNKNYEKTLLKFFEQNSKQRTYTGGNRNIAGLVGVKKGKDNKGKIKFLISPDFEIADDDIAIRIISSGSNIVKYVLPQETDENSISDFIYRLPETKAELLT